MNKWQFITQSKYKAKTLLETNKLCSQSTLQLQFIIFLGRVTYRRFLASPHSQPSNSLLWLLTLTAYTWAKSFYRTHRKIEAYSFASQCIHLKGDVNNNKYPTGYMFLDLSSPHDACQKRKIKRNREKLWLLHESKYIKVKDRPFAEGSRGCRVIICLYAQPLSAKERHVILPLIIATFIMQSVAFILHQHKFLQCSVFPYTKWSNTLRSNFYCPFCTDDNLLKGSYSIHR